MEEDSVALRTMKEQWVERMGEGEEAEREGGRRKTGAWEAMHLVDAAKAGQVDVIEYLVLECGVEVDVAPFYAMTPLAYAAERGDLETVQVLVERCNANPDGGQRAGLATRQAPANVAAQHGHVEVLRYLVQEAGVPVNDPDLYCGARPLHVAAFHGQCAVVKFLLQECGADVEAVGSYGCRPVHHAASELETLKLLELEGGADVSAVNHQERTVLHEAAARDAIDCVRFLLEETDIDLFQQDEHAQRPLDIARSCGWDDLGRFVGC